MAYQGNHFLNHNIPIAFVRNTEVLEIISWIQPDCCPHDFCAWIDCSFLKCLFIMMSWCLKFCSKDKTTSDQAGNKRHIKEHLFSVLTDEVLSFILPETSFWACKHRGARCRNPRVLHWFLHKKLFNPVAKCPYEYFKLCLDLFSLKGSSWFQWWSKMN